MSIKEILKKIWNRVASEPMVTVGVITAAATAATDTTWKGYAVAVVIAFLRFAVSPVVPKFQVDPKPE